MEILKQFIASFSNLSIEQVNALIALGAIGLAAFTIYVVFSVVKGHKAS